MIAVDHVLVDGRPISAGDVVRVRASRPGRRDAFTAVVRNIKARDDGVVEVEVIGARAGRPPAFRTFTPDRLTRATRAQLRGVR